MDTSSIPNGRALKAIIIEIIIIVVIIIALLFIFRIIPFNGLSLGSPGKNSLPISPTAPGVKLATSTYVLIGEVQSITLGTDGKYHLVLKQFPSQTFILDKNATVRNGNTLTDIPATDIKPRAIVRLGLSYNSQTQKWGEIPPTIKGGTYHLQIRN